MNIIAIYLVIASVPNLICRYMYELYGYNNVMGVSIYMKAFVEITEENWAMSNPMCEGKLTS